MGVYIQKPVHLGFDSLEVLRASRRNVLTEVNRDGKYAESVSISYVVRSKVGRVPLVVIVVILSRTGAGGVSVQ